MAHPFRGFLAKRSIKMQRNSFLLAIIFLATSFIHAAADLTQSLDALWADLPKDIHGAVLIQSPDAKTIYAKNIKETMVPASTTKLVTALAGLTALGPNWRWQTAFWQQGSISESALHGDLWLVMQGDPTFEQNDLNKMVGQLKTLGIKKIMGRVWIDISAYDRDFRSRGWAWEDLTEGYAAPLSAGIIERNRLWVDVRNDQGHAMLAVRPSGVATLRSHVLWQPFDPAKPFESPSCHLFKKAVGRNHYVFGGCARLPQKAKSIELAVWDLLLYLENRVAFAFKQSGIAIDNGVLVAPFDQKRPLSTQPIVHHTSKPLSELIAVMLKESDNLIAQSLFKQLAFQQSGSGASWYQASTALNQILLSAYGWTVPMIDDGAGASMYNRLSVQDQFKVLDTLVKRFSFAQDPEKWLAVMGRDGSLESRMQKTAAAGRFYGKTGTMSGVSSLVGFLKDRKGGLWRVAIMLQGNVGQREALRAIENKVIGFVLQTIG